MIVSSNFVKKFKIVCNVEFHLTQCLKIYVIIYSKDIIRKKRYILIDNFLSNHGDLDIFPH